MNNFFDLIDKYKFGIIGAMAVYMSIFMYLQMESYTQYFPIRPFHEGAIIQEEAEIELTPDQIEVDQNFQSEMKNMSRDMNDTRDKSMENYNENKSASQVEKSVKDYEKKLFEEAGGAAERKKIQQQMEQQKKEASSSTNKRDEPAKTGGDKSYAGNVMVEWALADRNPHQNRNWYVRNPGYTCGPGSNGIVTIDIKVNQNGDISSATYNLSRSSGATPCMIEQAEKYAKMSRFMYSAAAAKIQSGTIIYRFVSQ